MKKLIEGKLLFAVMPFGSAERDPARLTPESVAFTTSATHDFLFSFTKRKSVNIVE